MKTQEAISHFNYGINCDIFSEPVTSYAKLAVKALEQQMPKRPIARKAGFKSFDYECPCCKSRIISKIDGEWVAGKQQHYCDVCGQALDWSAHSTEKDGA